jgi:hypothetical protein
MRGHVAQDPRLDAGSGVSGQPNSRVRSVRREHPLVHDGSILLGGSINSWGSAPRCLSWPFDIFDILVN